MVYVVLLAKILGADLYGLFNYGLSWYLVFIPLSALGIDVIIVRGIGRDRDRASRLVGQTLALRSISCTSVALLSFLVGFWINFKFHTLNF